MVLIIKRIIAAVLCSALMLSMCGAAGADSAPYVSAEAAVVMNGDGQVVYEKNADAKLLIASTTKIMTAIVVIENTELDEQFEIRPEWCGLEGSSMYLEPGEQYTVRELLTGLLLASGNDAAMALACHTAGTQERFVLMMNRKARELKMFNSHFSNPHGLNTDGHYSTARDMALLMRYCMENDSFASIAGLKNCTVGEQTFINHNKLLSQYPGCIGGKTGYTEAAGRCLVSCCERKDTRFICVTLNAPDDWNDQKKLYDWAFSAFDTRTVTNGVSFDVPVISGNKAMVQAIPVPVKLFLPRDAVLSLEAQLPFFVFAPVEAGTEAGTVGIYLNGEKIAETKLLYEESVSAAVQADNSKESISESA